MSVFGERIKISVFGESHGRYVGATLEGLPAGFTIDFEKLLSFMSRRRPGKELTTKRNESDRPDIISGVLGYKTTGAPLTILISNSDTHSSDYSDIGRIPRPSHADYPAYVKYGGNNDIRGGGHFSARLTAPICAAGGILMQMLEKAGISIGSHIYSIGGVFDAPFDPVNMSTDILESLKASAYPVIDKTRLDLMLKTVESTRERGDSVGGIIECAVIGMKPGIGGPLFEGLDGCISKALFGIPAVKGVEFGAGFSASSMTGSKNNDQYYYDEAGNIRTKTNNSGGITGGMSNGMPIVFRAAFKPTPSISLPQDSVDLISNENTSLEIKGRHDPCVVLRAAPIVEAVAALTIADFVID